MTTEEKSLKKWQVTELDDTCTLIEAKLLNITTEGDLIFFVNSPIAAFAKGGWKTVKLLEDTP